MATELIESYGDLAANPDLAGRDVDTVAQLLREHGLKDDWLIAWTPDWLLEEKQSDHEITPAEGSNQILHGRIEHETEKAYCLAIGREDVWLPKSVITAFDRTPDAEIQIPQRGLGEFERGETA